KYGFHCHDLGTSVSIERMVDMAEKLNARAILISTIVTHADVHKQHMRQLDELVKARGLREQLVLIAGGTQVTAKLAQEYGMDAGFGHGATGRDVASFLMRMLRDKEID
ncbi:MAG: LuxR family transcriptional regulator, partial [Gammaproteobacteria bacterium]|nr:LuxR family transcriptional regulator [Gammaproteobacteria bacterium]